MRLPPTGENGRLAGRHREQAHSYSWIENICEKRVSRLGAIASKLCSYEEQKQNAHRFCFSPLNRMSVSSAAALDLDPRATSEG
jgi:hypothetical protein